jgi:hypothetical protein
MFIKAITNILMKYMRRLAFVGDVAVRTEFKRSLGLYETSIRNWGKSCTRVWRYSAPEDAEAGHNETVRILEELYGGRISMAL